MKDPVNKVLVLIITLAITVLFFSMIKDMLLTLLFAALFAALIRPMYLRINKKFKGRRAMASLSTIVIWLLLVFIPFVGFVGILANQALTAAKSYGPWVEENLSDSQMIVEWLESRPLIQKFYPEQGELIAALDRLVDGASQIFVTGLSHITEGTVSFFFLTFVLLYAMFFFLMYGDKLLHKILYYFPLTDDQESMILNKFTVVTRATLKGTFIIPGIQGSVAGLAMAVAGIPYTVFWGLLRLCFLLFLPSARA